MHTTHTHNTHTHTHTHTKHTHTHTHTHTQVRKIAKKHSGELLTAFIRHLRKRYKLDLSDTARDLGLLRSTQTTVFCRPSSSLSLSLPLPLSLTQPVTLASSGLIRQQSSMGPLPLSPSPSPSLPLPLSLTQLVTLASSGLIKQNSAFFSLFFLHSVLVFKFYFLKKKICKRGLNFVTTQLVTLAWSGLDEYSLGKKQLPCRHNS